MNFTFKKNERLCSKTIIDSLFEKSKFINAYPLRLSYLEYDYPDDIPGQVVFVVSKRRLKKAVDRNRTRRLIREAYRLQKHDIFRIEERKFAMAISFNGKEPLDLETARKSISKIITKLKEQYA
jgi:ribonuclease P protein component